MKAINPQSIFKAVIAVQEIYHKPVQLAKELERTITTVKGWHYVNKLKQLSESDLVSAYENR